MAAKYFVPRPLRLADNVKEGSLTYNDYASMPTDGVWYELANGVLEAMSPAPSPVHQLACKAIAALLDLTCEMDYIVLCAPIDVILSSKEVRQPDVVAVHKTRTSIITHRGIEGPPDLVVEIVSPSSARRDRADKLLSYALHGIPEYWIVTIELGTIEQFLLVDEGYRAAGVYTGDEPVSCDAMVCASVCMIDIVARIPPELIAQCR